MDVNFWHDRWESNRISFHNSETNPILVKYFQELSIQSGGRVFVPLCGKTLDIAWLLSKGFEVVGVELSKIAIDQLFKSLEIEPEVSQLDHFSHYGARGINIFVGDIFNLSTKLLGTIDFVYDRAALVALPEDMRRHYTAHLMELTNRASQLLITYKYDQNLMEGPPFSISKDELSQHYGDDYTLECVLDMDVDGGLKGRCKARENVWFLKNCN